MAKGKDKALKRTTDAVKKTDATTKQGFFKRIAQWFKDLNSELKKVVWPTRSQVINNTLVALVVIVLAAVVLWGFDSLAQMGVQTIINLV